MGHSSCQCHNWLIQDPSAAAPEGLQYPLTNKQAGIDNSLAKQLINLVFAESRQYPPSIGQKVENAAFGILKQIFQRVANASEKFAKS